MTAIFADFVRRLKILAAVGASMREKSCVIYLIAVIFPPGAAAGIVTKNFGLTARPLHEGVAAMFAARLFLLLPAQKGFDGVGGDACS